VGDISNNMMNILLVFGGYIAGINVTGGISSIIKSLISKGNEQGSDANA
jgi:uncharacterized ion transporter superfamily protein YfcC